MGCLECQGQFVASLSICLTAGTCKQPTRDTITFVKHTHEITNTRIIGKDYANTEFLLAASLR